MGQRRFDAKLIHTHTFPSSNYRPRQICAATVSKDAIKVVVTMRASERSNDSWIDEPLASLRIRGPTMIGGEGGRPNAADRRHRQSHRGVYT